MINEMIFASDQDAAVKLLHLQRFEFTPQLMIFNFKKILQLSSKYQVIPLRMFYNYKKLPAFGNYTHFHVSRKIEPLHKFFLSVIKEIERSSQHRQMRFD